MLSYKKHDIKYNLLFVVNQKYFAITKICFHSLFKNSKINLIKNVFIADIGLEKNSILYFKSLSPKISIIETGISIHGSKERHTKEWVNAVSCKTRVLQQLMQDADNLPLVMMDTDMFVVEDFSHVIDLDFPIQICKRAKPAQRPDMNMKYIGSFLIINSIIALPFVTEWIKRIKERILNKTVPAFETPALCELVDSIKYKDIIGFLDENIVSCNNNYIHGITSIIHMKSETEEETSTLEYGRIMGVKNYNCLKIIRFLNNNALNTNKTIFRDRIMEAFLSLVFITHNFCNETIHKIYILPNKLLNKLKINVLSYFFTGNNRIKKKKR